MCVSTSVGYKKSRRVVSIFYLELAARRCPLKQRISCLGCRKREIHPRRQRRRNICLSNHVQTEAHAATKWDQTCWCFLYPRHAHPFLSSPTVHTHILSVCLSVCPPGENLEGRFRYTKATPSPTKPASLTPTTPTTTSQRPMATAPARPPKTISQENALVHPPSPAHFPPPCCLTPSRCEGGRWRPGTAFGVRPSRRRPSENSCSRPRSPTTPRNWRVWMW